MVRVWVSCQSSTSGDTVNALISSSCEACPFLIQFKTVVLIESRIITVTVYLSVEPMRFIHHVVLSTFVLRSMLSVKQTRTTSTSDHIAHCA